MGSWSIRSCSCSSAGGTREGTRLGGKGKGKSSGLKIATKERKERRRTDAPSGTLFFLFVSMDVNLFSFLIFSFLFLFTLDISTRPSSCFPPHVCPFFFHFTRCFTWVCWVCFFIRTASPPLFHFSLPEFICYFLACIAFRLSQIAAAEVTIVPSSLVTVFFLLLSFHVFLFLFFSFSHSEHRAVSHL